jgi:hypothetical protein
MVALNAAPPRRGDHQQAQEPDDPPNSPTARRKREAAAAAATAGATTSAAAAAAGDGRAPQRRRSSLGGGGGLADEEGLAQHQQQKHGGDDDGGEHHQAVRERRRSSAGGGGSDDDENPSGNDEEEEQPLEEEEEEELEEIEEAVDDQPQRADDGLFIGPWACERDLAALKRRGITHVLQVADGLFPTHPLELNYCVIRVVDEEDEDIVAHFPQAFAFIESAQRRSRAQADGRLQEKDPSSLQAAAARAFGGGGGALVVCAAGVSRSASVCLGWLMRTRGWSFERALAALRDVRPWVCPNRSFEAQLRRFEALGADPARWRGWEVEKLAGVGEQQEQEDKG